MRLTIGALAVFIILISLSIAQEHGTPAADNPRSHEVQKAPAAEKVWADLIEGNQRFVSGKTKVRDIGHLRQELTKSQHPKAIILSCSDSRVPPELLFDKSLGELFVVRSAGNIADAIGLGSIEYAVEHLGSSVLVVLGHEKCGAVTAACSGEKMPSPNLQAIVDRISPAVSQANYYSKGDALVAAAIEENIHESAKNLLTDSAVLRHALKEGKLTIIEAIYSLETGRVTRLGKLSVAAPAYKLDVGDVVRVE